MDLRKFSDSANTYSPSILWDWCANPTPREIDTALSSFAEMGFARVYIRPTEDMAVKYLSEDFFELVRTAARRGARYNIAVWICDECGSSSGTGGGEVTSVADYRMRKITRAPVKDDLPAGELKDENGEYAYLLQDACDESSALRGGFAADITDPFVTECFIEASYAEYIRKCARFIGHELRGFCTAVRLPEGLLYSKAVFSEGYTAAELFENVAAKTAYFTSFNNALCKSFTDKLQNFCHRHSLSFGAGVAGNALIGRQLSYIASDNPYVDFSGSVEDIMQLKMLCSVAAQFEKRCVARVGTSSFAGCSEIYGLALSAIMLGANEICLCRASSTLSGRHKYEEGILALSPEGMREMSARISRALSLVNNTRPAADILLIYPSCAISAATAAEREKIISDFSSGVHTLLSQGVSFHIADEYNLAQNSAVQDNTVRIGRCAYGTLLLPNAAPLCDTTYRLCESSGASICAVGNAFAAATVFPDYAAFAADNRLKAFHLEGDVIVTAATDGEAAYAFVTAESDTRIFRTDGLFIADFSDGEIYRFTGEKALLKKGESAALISSAAIYADDAPPVAGNLEMVCAAREKELATSLVSRDENILPLKKVNACFGKKAYRESNIDDLRATFYSLPEGESVKLKFPFYVKSAMRISAYFENADDIAVLLNGKPLPARSPASKDGRFSGCDVSSLLSVGKNTFSLEYKKHSSYSRSVAGLNGGYLSAFADTSLEPVYLCGDFAAEEDTVSPPDGIDGGLDNYYGALTYACTLPESKLRGKSLTVDGRFDICKIHVGHREKLYFTHNPSFELFDIDCGTSAIITVYNTPHNLFKKFNAPPLPFGINGVFIERFCE